MRSIGGLVLITFGVLWILAGIFIFIIAVSLGHAAIQILVGVGFILLGRRVRRGPSSAEDETPDPNN